MLTSTEQIQETTSPEPQVFSLEDFLNHPLENIEWVDGQLIEKTGITLRHSQTQARLSYYWKNYILSSGQGGEVYTEALCRTNKQGRRPDVSYLTPELLTQYASATFLPQSFPLIAEIASPDDSAEELFAKAKEYLESGCQEVWLIYPETLWIIIITAEKHLLLTVGENLTTQTVLPGFSVAIDEILAFS
ncbi:MAG: Uma2 family endonuclease [Hassallia sp. WJT32-NPBG1]|nr:Uma2 family endonuclease [Hassallia sp. WJT32-NPBG1]